MISVPVHRCAEVEARNIGHNGGIRMMQFGPESDARQIVRADPSDDIVRPAGKFATREDWDTHHDLGKPTRCGRPVPLLACVLHEGAAGEKQSQCEKGESFHGNQT